jgi:hypothetical protein
MSTSCSSVMGVAPGRNAGVYRNLLIPRQLSTRPIPVSFTNPAAAGWGIFTCRANFTGPVTRKSTICVPRLRKIFPNQVENSRRRIPTTRALKARVVRASLRGVKRRSNPFFLRAAKMDCFASLAMTRRGRTILSVVVARLDRAIQGGFNRSS